MKSTAKVFGQALVILLLACAVGVGVNTAANWVDLKRDYSRKDEPNTHVDDRYTFLSFDQAAELYNDPMTLAGAYLWLDARSQEAFERGHIAGARHCDPKYIQNFVSLQPDVMAAQRVIVYCHGGECEDSLELADLLAHGGWVLDPSMIAIYKGGWEEWSQKQMPTATGAQ
jgi:rhodanese-related sulfurtransferase